ncbi:MAG: hypothetical protein HY840_10510 [Bacteroidetes bacterium]|nr:hypothetical protein [Bacteroidota bacterium]
MKKIFLNLMMSIIFVSISVVTKGQKDSSGVYMTSADFSNKKLTYGINCKKERHKIKLNSFFNRDYITVIHEGIKYNISKDSVFGFKTCNSSSYRIADKIDYTILNTDDSLLLYEFMPISAPKNPQLAVHKFSKGADGPMLDLTIENVKEIFPENHLFHDEVDNTFRSNNSLLSYDRYHKQYKLVRLFIKYTNGN